MLNNCIQLLDHAFNKYIIKRCYLGSKINFELSAFILQQTVRDFLKFRCRTEEVNFIYMEVNIYISFCSVHTRFLDIKTKLGSKSEEKYD